MDTVSSLLETFEAQHPGSKVQAPKTFIEAANLYMKVKNEDYGTETMDEISHKYYEDKWLKEAQRMYEEESTFKWPYTIAPYFTEQEIEDLQGYYTEHLAFLHDEPSGSRTLQQRINDLEEKLKNTEDPSEIAKLHDELKSLGQEPTKTSMYEDSRTQFEPITWDKKVRLLMNDLRTAEDPERIAEIKQSLVNLGWNPEIEYNAENKLLAKNRIERIYQEEFYNKAPMNITWLVENYNTDEIIQESNKRNDIKPIHIILVKGNSAFSNVITKITNSDFSHSAFCLDNDFNRLYSFNLDNKMNFTGGFSMESIEDYPKDNRLAIFSFFVKSDDWKKINNYIQTMLNYIKKTSYSVLNILAIPFKNINFNAPESMICSQFVDSILKLAHIDISSKDPSHVTPEDLYQSSKTNAKAYKIFDGITKNFDHKKAEKYIDQMSIKAKPFTESTADEFESILQDYYYPVVSEARQLPVKVTPEGDILLTKRNIDFDAEYSSSHKLLLQYDKAKNIDGMKYELARLYYMNYILEKKLYNSKFRKDKDKNTKTRARVLNDFNKYLKVILKAEPKFNFAEYYEDSVFSPYTIEVKKDTILKLKDIINYIL